MQVITDPNIPAAKGAPHAVTVGVYDGVHLGHKAVIAQTRRKADELGVKLALVTFDPHPASVLRPDIAPPILTCLEHKLELLESHDVDTVVVVPFDEHQRAESAADFVERVLVNCLNSRAVIVGADFHFGRKREGNVDVLTKLGQEHGFEVNGIEQVERPDAIAEPISSTSIRRALAGGEVGTAERLLGRLHQVRGVVAQGDKRGRTIGFPTANVDVCDGTALPADAVYAAWYILPDGSRHPAAVNIGKRPTFYQNAERSMLEAHLIGFDGDLYDQEAKVEFVELLRSEQRFDGLEALIEQLNIDVARSRAILGVDEA